MIKHQEKVNEFQEENDIWEAQSNEFTQEIGNLKDEIKVVENAEEDPADYEAKLETLEGEYEQHVKDKPERADVPAPPSYPTSSTFEMESVGRVYIMLIKKKS